MCEVRQTKPDENLGNIDFQGIFMSQLRKTVGHSRKLVHNLTTKPSIFEDTVYNACESLKYITDNELDTESTKENIYINNAIQYKQDTGIRTPTYAPKLAVLRSSALDHM